MVASRCAANAGTFWKVTPLTLPSLHSALMRIRPAGASRVSSVTGSFIGNMPISSSTVTTEMVFPPDIIGYSICSRMM
ncbi:hypothetical protein D3C84_1166230 [compost metagenome]